MKGKILLLLLPLVLAGCNKGETPSTEPSTNPSVAPSVEPSVAPSIAPSINPSIDPSRDPSVEPSVAPSVAPSVEPSVAPSVEPSEEPSEEPSLEPSVEPSEEPSLEPSIDPSEEPSEDPSLEPSIDPSEEPSEDPSVEPSTDYSKYKIDQTTWNEQIRELEVFGVDKETTFIGTVSDKTGVQYYTTFEADEGSYDLLVYSATFELEREEITVLDFDSYNAFYGYSYDFYRGSEADGFIHNTYGLGVNRAFPFDLGHYYFNFYFGGVVFGDVEFVIDGNSGYYQVDPEDIPEKYRAGIDKALFMFEDSVLQGFSILFTSGTTYSYVRADAIPQQFRAPVEYTDDIYAGFDYDSVYETTEAAQQLAETYSDSYLSFEEGTFTFSSSKFVWAGIPLNKEGTITGSYEYTSVGILILQPETLTTEGGSIDLSQFTSMSMRFAPYGKFKWQLQYPVDIDVTCRIIYNIDYLN